LSRVGQRAAREPAFVTLSEVSPEADEAKGLDRLRVNFLEWGIQALCGWGDEILRPPPLAGHSE
jgi:hypothetical protein